MGVKRMPVTNEQFYEAYHGGDSEESQDAAADNRSIMRAVSSRFSRTGKLDEDECSSCEMMALWRCLSYHDNTRGQKFTTSLHRFTYWECCKEAHKKRMRREGRISRDVLPMISRHTVDEHDSWSSDEADVFGAIESIDDLNTYIEKLPYSWQKVLIRQYYLQGMTQDEIGFAQGGCSKETIRLRLEQALQELKYVSCSA